MKRLVKLQYNSPVVLTFALCSLGALLLGFATDGWTTEKLFSVYRCSLADALAYPRFVLHVLGHSGYSHYIGNMMMVLVVGPPLEEKYGSRSLFWAIFLTALVAGLVQWLFFPNTALLGASGICVYDDRHVLSVRDEGRAYSHHPDSGAASLCGRGDRGRGHGSATMSPSLPI